MIISASYRTDLPAFYGEWFLNRLRAGWCMTTNPYNRKPVRVSLAPSDVDGFIFWTRNVRPFQGALAEVHRRGFPFIVLYTILGYPRPLDRRVVNADRAADSLCEVAKTFGSRVCVWRYDPILFTTLTPLRYHLDQFARLAARLEGATDEVVVSFAQFFRKTTRNLAAAGIEWSDPPDEQKREFVTQLIPIARRHGMQLSVCAQRNLLVDQAADARCVDARRLADVAGRPLQANPGGHRENCGCCQSRDIGDYDTCLHGCAYCYAVSSPQTARQRYRQHDPASPYLFTPANVPQIAPEPGEPGLFPTS